MGSAFRKKSKEEMVREEVESQIEELEGKIRQAEGSKRGFMSSGDNPYNVSYDMQIRDLRAQIEAIKQRGEEAIAEIGNKK